MLLGSVLPAIHFRTVGFLRKWIRWPVGFNMFLYKEQNTYLTFTEFEAISPLYWWANIFTNSTTPPYFYLLYFHSFKELQYKYNKKFWNFQIFLLFFCNFFFVPIVGIEPTPSRILTGDFCVFQDLLTAFQTLVDIILTRQ